MGVPKGFNIYDAYPTKKMAKNAAKDMKTFAGSPCFKGAIPRVRVVDLGKKAGRLRHAIYMRCPRQRM